jgi:hypothetical protein
MPTYNFVCDHGSGGCGAKWSRILRNPIGKLTEEEYRDAFMCKECGRRSRRDARGPTAQVKETLDNGAMTQRLERYKDAEKLYKDRAKQNR